MKNKIVNMTVIARTLLQGRMSLGLHGLLFIATTLCVAGEATATGMEQGRGPYFSLGLAGGMAGFSSGSGDLVLRLEVGSHYGELAIRGSGHWRGGAYELTSFSRGIRGIAAGEVSYIFASGYLQLGAVAGLAYSQPAGTQMILGFGAGPKIGTEVFLTNWLTMTGEFIPVLTSIPAYSVEAYGLAGLRILLPNS